MTLNVIKFSIRSTICLEFKKIFFYSINIKIDSIVCYITHGSLRLHAVFVTIFIKQAHFTKQRENILDLQFVVLWLMRRQSKNKWELSFSICHKKTLAKIYWRHDLRHIRSAKRLHIKRTWKSSKVEVQRSRALSSSDDVFAVFLHADKRNERLLFNWWLLVSVISVNLMFLWKKLNLFV